MTTKVFVAILLFPCLAFSSVRLPHIFSDNMVLQRNSQVVFHGWADPKERLTLTTSWDNKNYTTVADHEARWSLSFPTPDAGGPFTITVKGYNTVTFSNILIGEVWLCSGQSNMEMSASWGIADAQTEIAAANHPRIRFFQVPKTSAEFPQDDLHGEWASCTPETMKNFSATAYFFALRLREELGDIPIGLIQSAWGGTPAEIWAPAAAVAGNPEVAAAASKLSETEWGPNLPGRAFNAMINPFVGFSLAGVIWYQGESNVGSKVYDKTFTALIQSWRGLWRDDLPFYFVQIAPYRYEGSTDDAAAIRDAQRKVGAAVANSGMVVVSDVSAPDDLHPKNKKTVGRRLANLALSRTYGVFVGEVSGPEFRRVEHSGNKLIVYFDHARGLHSLQMRPRTFEIAGPDGVFKNVNARVRNGNIELDIGKLNNPKLLRYGWANDAKPELFNAEGLPASTFSVTIR